MECLGDETIAAYLDGALERDAVVRVDHHIDGCMSCRAHLSAVASSPVVHSFVLGARASGPTMDVLAAIAEARPGDPIPGMAIGRYIVESVIGRGAMGVVLRARDPELERAVAIKLVDPSARPIGLESGGWRARLRAEARAMARLRHPNVVTVYDTGSVGDQLFVAMELVEGESLAQRLALDRSGVLGLCIGAGHGLCAAHAAGLVHGDIKPDNILIDRDGRALLGDFGLARAIAESSATNDGRHPLIGTPLYMAPELLRREQADAATDQFAFAVTVYEAFAGSRPWHASSIEELLGAIEREPPARPHAMPRAVWRVVVRGLAVEPAARYRSMAEFVADLERADRHPIDDGADELTTQDGRPIDSLTPAATATANLSRQPTTSTRIGLGFVTLVPGTLVGDYEIEKLLGAGAMAQVYGARHERLGKRVAIKVIAPRLCADRDLVERFEQEARALAQLSHPNIVNVLGFGQLPGDGRSYFVMEWLDGESLQERLDRGRMTLCEALEVIDQIAKALGAAHERGVIHRDLKPGNCWLQRVEDEPRPVVKLLDFGLAKLAADFDRRSEGTQTGVIFGTARYMSPEQAQSSRDVDSATDIYALGCTAYELVCGQPPFPHNNMFELMTAHRVDEPPVPSTLTRGIPVAVDRLLLAMLDKDPGKRPSPLLIRQAVAEALEAVSPPTATASRSAQLPTGAVSGAPHHAAEVPAVKPSPARRGLVIAIAVTCALAIGAVVVGSQSGFRNSSAVPAPALDAGVNVTRTLVDADQAPPTIDAGTETAVTQPEPDNAPPPAAKVPAPKKKPRAITKPVPAGSAKPHCDPYDLAEGC